MRVFENTTTQEFIKIGETDPDQRYYMVENLSPNTGHYLMVTATNENGEGYRCKTAFLVVTMKESAKSLNQLYVWGSNTFSEIGLSGEMVENNKQHFIKTKKKTCLYKPVIHEQFA